MADMLFAAVHESGSGVRMGPQFEVKQPKPTPSGSQLAA
jgi:hypothetical protein